MSNLWHDLPKPIVGLSPMDGVTDAPFRYIQKKYGHPDVVFTEFTSTEGVCHGADRLLNDFLFDEIERPVIAQIYGSTPNFFRQTATILCELGFDGIDINMGCPAKNVAHSGAGAALIKTPALAQEIVRQTKAGVTDYLSGKRAQDCQDIQESLWRKIAVRHAALPTKYQIPRKIPVSVKTRLGYSDIVIEDWIKTLLEVEPVAITFHGRTLTQHYSGEANWEAIGQAAILAADLPTLVLGNGDVQSRQEALTKAQIYGVDGVLIGRASFGNPSVFLPTQTTTQLQLFTIAIEHAQRYEETFGQQERYSFLPMRKHLGWYVKGIHNATQVRAELYQTNTAGEAAAVLSRHQLLDTLTA